MLGASAARTLPTPSAMPMLEMEPADIYTEALTRTNVGNGPVWMTFTPLQGVSEVVRRFLHEHSPDRNVTSMTIDDVDHYSEEEKASPSRMVRSRWSTNGARQSTSTGSREN